MSMYECPKCGGVPGVTVCCSDAQPAQAESASCGECGKKTSDGWALYCVACMEKAGLPAQAGQVLTVEAIEAACDDADKNSEYSCGFYAGVRWHEAHLRAIARATHKE